MKNRVFQRPLPDANVPRNAFDLSKRISLNMPFGALIPVYSHQYIAGSHIKINMRTFFRTAAVNTAAFPQLKLNFEWFCVPLRFLWSYWDNFKLGISDYNSSALLASGVLTNPTAVPSFYFNRLRHEAYLNRPDGQSISDAVGYSWGLGAARLSDMLGYGRFDCRNDVAVDSYDTGQRLNAFKALAYQKIYFDHFRNTAYESNNVVSYNMDSLTRNGDGILGSDELLNVFRLRYANYRKDYFQHIFPSLNYVVSSPSAPMSSIPSWIQGVSYGNLNTGVREVTSSTQNYNNAYLWLKVSNSDTSFSAQSLRALFALDKLQRSSAYAPKHVKDQYEARYGIKFSDKNSFESIRIGNFDTDIVIGEVTSTANTSTEGSGDALGAIGGKGVGASNGNSNFIDFNVAEDSIVMCIAYAIPRQQYDSYRWENWNMKLGQNDFFIPEFMNLGLKPLYVKEIKNTSTSLLNNIVGYQTPYMEYKSDVDENHGLFADVVSDLGQFVMHTNSTFSSYGTGVSYDYFKVKPSDVDSIFVNAYDGTESTDQLFGQIDFMIPVNMNMSVHGQPSL